ncbi:type II toxin-antitoxin system VapC family toxin [Halorhodospira halophila]|uniref:type II toxin-antitoxin system VapC family toxin n=1 Tax=Halorhodospira halophila TaxID=1053 RepID=UPI001911B901|nr:type II toxin-antitoxin system VapC family toxin [Halorhodospira halophila]MBK5936144.1 VapC toxin family PIN domain ribonuclease [Halorhodospira halophila]
MLYADTSAILPYYRQEPASAVVERLFMAQPQPVAISRLTRMEVASALARWVHMEELTEAQANRVESAFHEDLHEGRFRMLELDPSLYDRAMHWLLARRTSLRTLDALHLACAEAHNLPLLTFDAPLRTAAEFLGVRTCELRTDP